MRPWYLTSIPPCRPLTTHHQGGGMLRGCRQSEDRVILPPARVPLGFGKELKWTTPFEYRVWSLVEDSTNTEMWASWKDDRGCRDNSSRRDQQPSSVTLRMDYLQLSSEAKWCYLYHNCCIQKRKPAERTKDDRGCKDNSSRRDQQSSSVPLWMDYLVLSS